MMKNLLYSFWLLAIVTCAVLVNYTDNGYAKPVGVLLFGIAIGFVLQRSRFCISSAFSDLILFKDGKLFKAVVLLIAISTIGFSVLQANGKEGFVVAIGLRTLIGAILFGIGMTVAGGCAVATLMRIGEGYVLFTVVLVGLLIGGTIGAYHYYYWGAPSAHLFTIFLPKYFGWTGSVILQLFLLLTVWLIVDRG
jgi:uncharacterized protein